MAAHDSKPDRLPTRAKGRQGGASEPSSISSTLLEQIRARQPEAWQRLVCLYGPVVYRWCRRYGVARDDAPDLVQDVFAVVALHIDRFHRDRPGDSFAAWLRTVTRNVIRGYYRSRRGQPVAQGGTDAQQQFLQVPELPKHVESGNSQETRGLIMPIGLDLVRAEFENHTWEAFRRVAIERQSSAQVAVDLGMSIAAVYQAKSRVLRRLRQELDALME
jgi:RNA polymerase sigma-70 factor (ECF subfamily)